MISENLRLYLIISGFRNEESVLYSTAAENAIYESLQMMYSDQRRTSNQPPLHIPPRLSRHREGNYFTVF